MDFQSFLLQSALYRQANKLYFYNSKENYFAVPEIGVCFNLSKVIQQRTSLKFEIKFYGFF